MHRVGDDCKVYVGGIQNSVMEDELRILFEKECGDVKSVCIHRSRPDSCCKYGFVKFYSPGSVTKAINRLDNRELHGRRINVAVFHAPTSNVNSISCTPAYDRTNTQRLIGEAQKGAIDHRLRYLKQCYEEVSKSHSKLPPMKTFVEEINRIESSLTPSYRCPVRPITLNLDELDRLHEHVRRSRQS